MKKFIFVGLLGLVSTLQPMKQSSVLSRLEDLRGDVEMLESVCAEHEQHFAWFVLQLHKNLERDRQLEDHVWDLYKSLVTDIALLKASVQGYDVTALVHSNQPGEETVNSDNDSRRADETSASGSDVDVSELSIDSTKEDLDANKDPIEISMDLIAAALEEVGDSIAWFYEEAGISLDAAASDPLQLSYGAIKIKMCILKHIVEETLLSLDVPLINFMRLSDEEMNLRERQLELLELYARWRGAAAAFENPDQLAATLSEIDFEIEGLRLEISLPKLSIEQGIRRVTIVVNAEFARARTS